MTESMESTEELPQEEQEVLRVAIACIVSACESIVTYEALLNYLQDYIQMPIQVIQRGTYAEVNDLLRAGTVDLAFISSYSYVTNEREFGCELLAVPVLEGQMPYCSYIIVHQDSMISSFEELRGKSFTFTDPGSTMGRLYPLYLLKQMGEKPDDFFSYHIFTYSSDNAMRSVADFLVFGAAVNSLVYHHLTQREPVEFKDLVVIHKSESLSTNPVVTKAGLNEEMKEKLRSFFITMHKTEEGRRILSDLKFTRFEAKDSSYYDDIRLMIDYTVGRDNE
jgi:phosphonate transport system substrate-binding protein